MLRRLYVWLLNAHPRWFRERFAAEMLWIFDREGRTVPLLLDAGASALRQWCFRLEDASAEPASAGGPPLPVPRFYSAPEEGPRPAALAEGSLVAFLVMAAMLFLMGRGGQGHRVISIGTSTPRSGLLEVRTGEGPSNLTTSVAVKAPRQRPTRGILFDYYQLMPVLSAIDTDRDLVLSTEEMDRAPAALRLLDLNRDGKLTPEECGLSSPAQPPTADDLVEELMAFDRNHDGKLESNEVPQRLRGFLGRAEHDPDGKVSAAAARRLADREASPRKAVLDPDFLRRSRPWFLRVHPVLAALDTDADGVISAVELATAGAALRTLDWNRDGDLTAEEILPDPVVNAVAAYFITWDQDADGRLTIQELASVPKPAREVVASADRDADKVITSSELRNEIRRRAIADGDGGDRQLQFVKEHAQPRR